MSADELSAIAWVKLIWCAGLIVTGLEAWWDRRDFSPTGFFSWQVIKRDTLGAGWRAILEPVSGPRAFAVITVLRLLATVALLFLPLPSLAASLALALVFLALAHFHLRAPFGLDGADQMQIILAGTLLLASLCGGTSGILSLCLWFVTFQFLLSYTTAGVAKLISSTWRSGNAMVFIMDTESYGSRRLSGWLLDRRWRPAVVAWTVIAIECLSIPAFLVGGPVLESFLIVSLLLHIGVAIVMGLNSFLFAFVAPFPALLYTAAQLQAWWG